MLHVLCNVKQKLKEVECEVRGESIKDEEWGWRVRSGRWRVIGWGVRSEGDSEMTVLCMSSSVTVTI